MGGNNMVEILFIISRKFLTSVGIGQRTDLVRLFSRPVGGNVVFVAMVMMRIIPFALLVPLTLGIGGIHSLASVMNGVHIAAVFILQQEKIQPKRGSQTLDYRLM